MGDVRKRKLDATGPEPSARDKFLLLLKAGHSVRAASGLAGFSLSTYYRQRGADREFALDSDKARGVALSHVEGKLLGLIEENNVTAIIFYLKSRAGENWGSNSAVVEAPELVPPEEDPETAARIFGKKPS